MKSLRIFLSATALLVGAAAQADPVDLPFADSFSQDGTPQLSSAWAGNEAINGTYVWQVGASAKRNSSENAYPYDDDNGLLWFNCYDARSGNSGRLISPEFTKASATNPVLAFRMTGYYSGSQADRIVIEARVDGGEWQDVDGATFRRIDLDNSSEWFLMEAPLAQAISSCQSTWQFAIKAISEYGYNLIIDDVQVYNKKLHDLAVTLSGPVELIAGNRAQYSVLISNLGAATAPAGSYTITLDKDHPQEVTLPQTIAIEPGRGAPYTFTVDYHAGHIGTPYTFAASVAYDPDEDLSNNVAEALSTIVSGLDKAGASEATATRDPDGSVTLTWTPAIDMTTYQPLDIYESWEVNQATNAPFEDEYTADYINGWRIIDNDGKAPSYEYGIDFSVFSIYNYFSGPRPSDGNSAIAVGCIGGEQQEDWLISPPLTCMADATINLSFVMALKTFSAYGNELKWDVLYSTTTNDPEAFTGIVKQGDGPAYGYSSGTTPKFEVVKEYTGIPAEAKHIALYFHNKTTGAAYPVRIWIDELAITDSFEAVDGYNIYEAGERINDTMLPATATSYTIAADNVHAAPETAHAYTVVAVYTEGESNHSNVAALAEVLPVASSIADMAGIEGTFTVGAPLTVIAAADGAAYVTDGTGYAHIVTAQQLQPLGVLTPG